MKQIANQTKVVKIRLGLSEKAALETIAERLPDTNERAAHLTTRQA